MVMSAPRCGRIATLVALASLAAACSTQQRLSSRVDPKYGVSASPRVVADGEAIPKGGGTFRTGKPYTIAGRTYVPLTDPTGYREEGIASWYGDDFHGRLTANGEVYDMHAISAAHPTLPIPSFARVTSIRTGRSIIVRINDRGPFAKERVIDLSVRTAKLLDFHSYGVARVRVEYVGPATLDGTDDKILLATLRDNGQPAPAPSAVMVASAAPFVRSPPRSVLLRGPAPLPPDRPFEFGAGDHPLVAASLQASSRSGLRPAETASAFAAPEPSSTSAASTGRGLY